MRGELRPSSKLGEAVEYALARWSSLLRYLEDGRLAIDTNHLERQFRPIAVGRSNWLFLGRETAGPTAATLYTVIQSEPVYREVLADLYSFLKQTNQQFFQGRLHQPHLTIGQTPTRSFGFCKPLTDWGGETQITVAESVYLGKHRVVVNRWSAEGSKRFIRDLVLHEQIHQWQWEVAGNSEPGYRGHGPLFAKCCNEIGAQLGLAAVIPRRRGRKDGGKPIANYWPYNVRPAHFYAPDIDLEQAIGNLTKPKHESECVQCLENILGFLEVKGVDATRRLLQREINRQRAKHACGDGALCGTVWIDALDEVCD